MSLTENINKIKRLNKIRSYFIYISILDLAFMSTRAKNYNYSSLLGIISISSFVLSICIILAIQVVIIITRNNLQSAKQTDLEKSVKKGTPPEYSLPVSFTNNTGVSPFVKMIKILGLVLLYIFFIAIRSKLSWDHITLMLSIGLLLWTWSMFRSISLINFSFNGVHFLSAGYAKWRLGRGFLILYDHLEVKQEPTTIGIKTYFFNQKRKYYTLNYRFWSESWEALHNELKLRLDADKYVILEKPKGE